ncbi:S8 family serine peptidase [uncultured Massilia sp.]|uniref:S8 family serine peptidase n=1 Tax=uncultured Massilia sp. TaxID=169973 RepID=UPI0025DC3873|nr:S8 family serine peptidase [uncultured Massilia sp.]
MSTTTTLDFLPLGAAILSTDTGQRTQIVITNHAASALKVFWIDRAGVEQPYGEIAPGASWRTDTVGGHAWKVVGADGTTGFKFLATLPGEITVGAGGAPSFFDFSEHVGATPLGDWSTAQGYGLINVAASLGVADLGATLPMNGQNNNLALNLISASSAWAAGYTGKGVKVAVVDIGIAAHPEIDGNLAGGVDLLDNDADPRPTPGTYQYHALGVASIIAASHAAHGGRDTMGVAPDASLLSVRIGDGNNSSDKVALGIRWAVDNGARVISLPLGSGSTAIDGQIDDAIHYAYQHDVVVVIAGGNNSHYGATGPALSAQSGEAIAVGNLNALAGSPYASSNQPGQAPFPWVMAGSSGYVPTGDGAYAFYDDGGTSFAGPYVAGLAALLFQQSPHASARDVIASIVRGAALGPGAANDAPHQVLAGGDGADWLGMAAGIAAIDGKAGIDTVQFGGKRADYTIAHAADGFHVGGKDGAVVLSHVERLAFDDATVAIDIDGNAGMVYRLYQAAFGRTPDSAGLGFWIQARDAGQSLEAIASQFMRSDEAARLYGAQAGNADLIQAVYRNVLHRAPDQAGYDYWLAALDHGDVPVAQLLTSFSESAENQQAVAQIVGNGFAFTPYH